MSPLMVLLTAISTNTLWFGHITNSIDLSNGLCYGPSFRDTSTQTCVIGEIFELEDGKGYVVVDENVANRQKKGDMFYCSPTLCRNMPVK